MIDGVFYFIGLWASALICALVLLGATYLVSHLVCAVVVKKLSSAYQWVSVLYYMNVCLKHGRAGLLKEAEDAKKEGAGNVR